ncbi:MAG: putative lipid II flippase FtsW [Treponema sp.]|jgi:cell division protein FtsW|nr:putative lipid II flippase FtsW [Treponema sp.]
MHRFNVEKTRGKLQADQILIASILMLIGIGLVTLYSSSYGLAERDYGGGLYFISKQLMLGFVGMALFFLASRINLDVLRKGKIPILLALGGMVLCVLPLIPGMGMTKNGATRWVSIGSLPGFQPSEFVKLILPLYLAHIFDKKQDHLDSFVKSILPPFFMILGFIVLIYLQNNFSTALFIAVNGVFIFWLAGVRIRYFLSALVIFVPFSILLVLIEPHRWRRLLSFMNPAWEPHGAGYQVRASVMTIASGGFWGKGMGQNITRIAAVPEIHSDFIFSAYAEAFGFLGVLLFFVLFGVFALRGYRAAMRSEETFRRLLAFGLVSMIVSQTLVNIAVTSGTLPATGIPLPFFSAGGSSLLVTLVATGIVVNISRSPQKSGFFVPGGGRFARKSEAWYAQEPEAHHVR